MFIKHEDNSNLHGSNTYSNCSNTPTQENANCEF